MTGARIIYLNSDKIPNLTKVCGCKVVYESYLAAYMRHPRWLILIPTSIEIHPNSIREGHEEICPIYKSMKKRMMTL